MASDRLQQLLAFLEENPNDSFITFAIAKEYEGLENLDKALSFYQRLRDQDPAYIGTYYHLGKLFEQLGHLEKALDTYTSGMQVAQNQGDQHAYSELAGAKLNIED